MAHPFITDAQATQKIQESYNEIVNSIGTGFQGTIKNADTPTEEGIYIPTEAGIYPNAGGLEYAPEGNDEGYLVQFIFDGSEWVKSSVLLPKSENRIETWVDGAYNSGEQRLYNGQIWTASTGTLEGDVPGVSYKWVPELDFILPEDVAPTINMVNQAFTSSVEPTPTPPVVTTQDYNTSIYGASFGIYHGWGFPVGVQTNFNKVTIPVEATPSDVTQFRLIIKEVDYNGIAILDETFPVIPQSGVIDLVAEFTRIENLENKRLWVEFYTDAPVGVFKTPAPAKIFTQEDGYPATALTEYNDMGASGVTAGALWSDFKATFEGYVFEITATDRLKEIISEEVENTPLPEDIEDATFKTNSLFDSEYIKEEDDFVPFVDTTGAVGGTNYKSGFPIGEREPFKTLTVGIYKTTAQTPVVQEISAILHVVDKDGDVIATSLTSTVPAGGTGRYNVNFAFSELVNNEGRIYVELVGDGKFGFYVRYPNPTSIFTEANGYPPTGRSGSPSAPLVTNLYHDVWSKTDVYTKKVTLTAQGEELFINKETPTFDLPNENWFISFIISSVTWGDGFLQSGYVKEFIKWLQSDVANSFTASQINKGTPLSNRKYFSGEAVRLEGIGEEIEFNITGNEVSIIQAIDRSNINASEIEVYIDGNLYDTFNNFNEAPIGNESKVFIGDGTAALFDLNKPFTYSHVVTLNGNPQVVTHNKNASTGFTIPAGSNCGIIRKLGQDENGNPAVTHWLWFKNTPASGDEISVTYDYGANLFYEKTTIGETANGSVECPYGEGDVSFDPTQPSSISAGLDFRQTDERVVKTYRFLEEKTRSVRIRIKGLYGSATGTPYFIFNFATNRYFNFQNAGIGGWDLWDFDKNIDIEPLRGFQNVLAFNPDILIAEGTPNDDWHTAGHKLYDTRNLTLAQLRSAKTFPLRSIAYQSGTDTYDISKWRGHITGITKTSVTFSGDVSSPIVAGDYVVIGQYWSNNFDYIERLISSIDGNTIYFDKPISDTEVIYDSIDDFIGKEIGVRSYDNYKNKLQSVLDKLHASSDMKIHLLENPMPNLLARELWGYPILNDKMANANPNTFSVIYNSLREWQYSQPKTSVQVDISGAVVDSYINKPVVEFGSNGQNLLATDILLNGESIYGTRAVVESGWAYVVDQSKTGIALNKSVAASTATNQVFNGRRPRVVILDETLTSATLTVKYATSLWSFDSCHMNINSSKLYADFLKGSVLNR